MTEKEGKGPLSGIRVLDLTHFLSGPFCTLLMSDLGAEVIKIEKPLLGDQTRYAADLIGQTSTNYTCRNRGKKSVVMDLGDSEQRDIFLRMVREADAVISNFKTGTMERLGLGYEVLKKENPRIVDTVISGFGADGPWKGKAAFDGVIQAVSGAMTLTGEEGGQPLKCGLSIADLAGGLFGAAGTLSALLDAKKTGQGRLVDISMLDGLLSMMEISVSRCATSGVIPVPHGNRHQVSAPFCPFMFGDGKRFFVTCATDSTFYALCDLIGAPELKDDARFRAMADRSRNGKELEVILQKIMLRMDSETFRKKMDERNLPYAPVNTLPDILESEYTAARNMLVRAVYPDGTVYRTQGCAVKMSGMTLPTEYPVRPLGYDTMDVLSEYTDEETRNRLFRPLLEQCRKAAEKRYSL